MGKGTHSIRKRAVVLLATGTSWLCYSLEFRPFCPPKLAQLTPAGGSSVAGVWGWAGPAGFVTVRRSGASFRAAEGATSGSRLSSTNPERTHGTCREDRPLGGGSLGKEQGGR